MERQTVSQSPCGPPSPFGVLNGIRATNKCMSVSLQYPLPVIPQGTAEACSTTPEESGMVPLLGKCNFFLQNVL